MCTKMDKEQGEVCDIYQRAHEGDVQMPTMSGGPPGLHESSKEMLITSGNGTGTEEFRPLEAKVENITKYLYRECLRNHDASIGGRAVDGCGEFMIGGAEGTSDALKCAACGCHRNFHRREVEGKYLYRECLKNHDASTGGHAIDGCGEFMPGGEEGTLDALKCAACNCHRNFHRREVEGEPPCDCHQIRNKEKRPTPDALPPTPLALPATPDDKDGGISASAAAMKKRFRTKFSREQKVKMLSFADKLGWKIQKHEEGAVQAFCAEIGVRRHVLKVWMHNNRIGSLSYGSTRQSTSNVSQAVSRESL